MNYEQVNKLQEGLDALVDTLQTGFFGKVQYPGPIENISMEIAKHGGAITEQLSSIADILSAIYNKMSA